MTAEERCRRANLDRVFQNKGEIISFSYKNNKARCKFRVEDKLYLLTASSNKIANIGFNLDIINEFSEKDDYPKKIFTNDFYFKWKVTQDKDGIVYKLKEIKENK